MSNLAPDKHATHYPRRCVAQIMAHVMLALLPGTLLQMWLINDRLLLTVPTAILGAMLFEAIALRLRDKHLLPSLNDGSIIVAAWLLALCVPPTLPLWQLLLGVFLMVMLGKHLYGGLGHNPFNPAMVAFAVLIISFPVSMTDWPSGQADAGTDTERGDPALSWDGLSGATPLDQLRQRRLQDKRLEPVEIAYPSAPSTQHSASDIASPATVPTNEMPDHDTGVQIGSLSYSTMAQQLIMNSNWKWINLAWFAGGLYLLAMRIISWHIPVAVLSAVTLMYAGFGLNGSATTMPWFPALLSGAIMLGAFFIATDPVTAAASRTGKLIYGLGVGVLAVIIREFSSYPEGFAFAILLMNTCVPLIDYLLTGPVNRSRSNAP